MRHHTTICNPVSIPVSENFIFKFYSKIWNRIHDKTHLALGILWRRITLITKGCNIVMNLGVSKLVSNLILRFLLVLSFIPLKAKQGGECIEIRHKFHSPLYWVPLGVCDSVTLSLCHSVTLRPINLSKLAPFAGGLEIWHTNFTST